MLKVGGLALIIREGELDRGMFFGPRIDLARSFGEIELLGFGGVQMAA